MACTTVLYSMFIALVFADNNSVVLLLSRIHFLSAALQTALINNNLVNLQGICRKGESHKHNTTILV